MARCQIEYWGGVLLGLGCGLGIMVVIRENKGRDMCFGRFRLAGRLGACKEVWKKRLALGPKGW